jgi:hypothetical protein
LPLVGLATGFTLLTFAQQKDTFDSQTVQQLDALDKKFDEAFENDDAAVAALFTEDAALSRQRRSMRNDS